MALTGDTGNGATLLFAAGMGFGTSTTSMANAIDISIGAITVGTIEVSTLTTTDHKEFIPSDLRDSEENTVTYKWLTTHAATVANDASLPGAAGSITLTLPTRTGETTAAQIQGTGFITSFKPPTLANGELQVGEIKWKWDGDTGPTYTDAS